MKNQLSILSFALSLFFLSVITVGNAQSKKERSSGVTVTRNVSACQRAADGRPMVVVTVTIKKNGYKGPGRIEENFSNSLQAIMITNGGAAFQTGNGKAEFAWNNISESREVSVSYALLAAGKVDENQNVSGQFIYGNQSYSIVSSYFSFKGGDYSSQPVAPTSTTTLDDIYYAVTGSYPESSRPASSSMASNKGASSSPANTAPATATSSQPAVTTSSSTPIQQSSGSSTPAQQTTETPAPAQQPVAANTPAAQQSPDAATGDNRNLPAASTPGKESGISNNDTKGSTSNAGSSAPPAMASSDGGSSSSEGLVYRVQVIVVGDKGRLNRFFKKHNVTEQVYYDPANGTPVRVMVGNFPDYNAAKAHCGDLKTKGLKESFIVSYYMGKRITTAEAATHTTPH